MGRSYTVPRSAKGESRILYIFTMKSFVTTLVGGIIGAIIYFIAKMFMEISIFTTIVIIVPFAALGFAIGAAKIPDTPMMGPLQKAGGENVSDILWRVLTFKSKKKLYVYGQTREIKKDAISSKNNSNVSKIFKI